MVRQTFLFRTMIAAIAISMGFVSTLTLQAQEEKRTREPVFRQAKLPGQKTQNPVQSAVQDGTKAPTESTPRIARRNDNDISANNRLPAENASASATAKKHPLDGAVSIAEDGLRNMQENIFDYTAMMVKRERVNGQLGDVEYLRIKVRNERNTDAGAVPFSIYMNFLKPKAVKGREVVWVKGQNNNKLSAHETGIGSFKTFHLDPDGWLAMRGNRYPIYEAGLENLIVRLIEKASRDRAAGACQVEYRDGAKINGRKCKLIEVIHNERRAPYEFHKAQVFIDEELQLPIRYASYDWPATPGGKPVLMEEYTYVDIKLNVGLKDIDFDISNPEYNFPGR